MSLHLYNKHWFRRGFRFGVVFAAVFVFAGLQGSESAADTVYFKDGTVAEGEVILRKSYYIDLKQGEQVHRIYADEYDRIEEGFQSQKLDQTPRDVEGVEGGKQRLVVRMIEASGVHESMVRQLESVIQSVPEEKRMEMREILNVNAIIDVLIPVYDRHYSEEELKAIVEFYESSAGRKMLEATPEIMRESLQILVEYFQTRMNP